MIQILPYIQIFTSLLLVTGILLQRSEGSLGSAFGSDGAGTRFTRRGLEKLVFNATIVLAILYSISAFANLFLGQ